jgi:DNA-binding IclR family transcriptional regulator
MDSELRIRSVPAVTRAVAVLRFLSRAGSPQPLHAIAAATHTIPSTCLHILRALAAENLVAFEAQDKRYRLDVGILSISRRALRANRVATLAQPAVEQVAESRQVVTVATQLSGKHMIVMALARPRRPLQLAVEVGSRMPAYVSATGRCYAAFGPALSREALRDEFRSLRWDVRLPFAQWLDEVELTRQRGWGVDDGNYIRGVISVAAPVRGPQGVMTWGLVAVGIREQIAQAGIERLGKEIRRRALGIEVELQARR